MENKLVKNVTNHQQLVKHELMNVVNFAEPHTVQMC